MGGELRRLETLYAERQGVAGALATEAGDRVAAERRVPACPSWSAKDLLCHLAGVCSDVLEGNIEGAATDAWTAAQVSSRTSMTASEVIDEWDELTPRFAAMLDDFPGWYGTQVLADLTLHEQDLRGTFGCRGGRSSEALLLSVDFLVSAIAHPAAVALGLAPLEVTTGERSWAIGTTDPPSGDPGAAIVAALAAGNGPGHSDAVPEGALSAEPFELCRALCGRRSARQISRLDWSIDPAPYLELFSQGPFRVRSTDLDE